MQLSFTIATFHRHMHHFIYDRKGIVHNIFRGKLLCAGNLGNLLLIILPAVCDEDNSPFGDSSVCSTDGEAYAALSMAVIVYCSCFKITKINGCHSKTSWPVDLNDNMFLSASNSMSHFSVNLYNWIGWYFSHKLYQ